jgi:hypothetical protein
MTSTSRDSDALDAWVLAVEKRHRRRRLIARTLRDERSGLLTIPVRFALAVAEVGPVNASRMALNVARSRLGRR